MDKMNSQTNPTSFKNAAALTGLAPTQKISNRVVYSVNITAPSISNSRTSEFFDIIYLLDDLSAQDVDSDFYIGAEVKTRAIEILSWLKDVGHIELPKVLPEGPECLSLTWDRHPWKSFLTIYPDEVEGMTYNRTTGIRCTEQLESAGVGINPLRIFSALAVVPKPNTVDFR
jgi:hypothetical protein